NTDRLIGRRRRPWVGLSNTVDSLVQHIDEFARPSAERIDTENLCVRILVACPGGSAYPVVLSDGNRKIRDRIIVWRTAQVFPNARGLVVRSDLISVEEIHDIRIDR